MIDEDAAPNIRDMSLRAGLPPIRAQDSRNLCVCGHSLNDHACWYPHNPDYAEVYCCHCHCEGT